MKDASYQTDSDEFQTPEFSYMHGMRSSDQSISEATSFKSPTIKTKGQFQGESWTAEINFLKFKN